MPPAPVLPLTLEGSKMPNLAGNPKRILSKKLRARSEGQLAVEESIRKLLKPEPENCTACGAPKPCIDHPPFDSPELSR